VFSVVLLISLHSGCSFLDGFFFTFFFSFRDVTVLDCAQDVFVVVLANVGYDILGVLFSSQSQVCELTTLVGEERCEGLLGLHDEVSHESGVLNSRETVTFFIRLGEHLDGNTIVVN